MNLKAIIASLVLGSSSAAIAAPAVTVTSNTVVRDHRFETYRAPAAAPLYTPVAKPVYTAQPETFHSRVFWRRSFHQRPVVFASGTHFGGDGRAFITVPEFNRRFHALEITAAGGRTHINQVYIEFDNGQEQVIRNLGATLRGNESMRLDLDGDQRNIRRIVVYGKNLGGWRNSGGFNLSAI